MAENEFCMATHVATDNPIMVTPFTWLDVRLTSVLAALEECPAFFDQNARTFYSIGVIRTLLDGFAATGKLTLEQRDLVKRICETWDQLLQTAPAQGAAIGHVVEAN